jgi:colanic acid/amylovoran biosynthesis glycosyltransferase
VATSACGLSGERQLCGNELSIRERTAVHDCRNVSRSKSSRQARSIVSRLSQQLNVKATFSNRQDNMRTIAYITNLFPAPVEPYVMQEITELRCRGVAVIPCSARRPGAIDAGLESWASQTLYIQPLRLSVLMRALWLSITKMPALSDIVRRALFQGHESPSRRIKAMLHTLLGAYLAVLLKRTSVDHIHVHHGYFSCWIAMVAARLGGITYSVTLHGSDLLLHKAYLDTKLNNCQFCVTVSEFNRRHILEHYLEVSPKKIFVRRMGVVSQPESLQIAAQTPLIILAVGRLHHVKNHAFLIKACGQLKRRGRSFACLIAGEGPERQPLQVLIKQLHLEHEVRLLGHLSASQLDAFYANSNLVVLTSRSEGLPLSLMEAMARRKVVLAPAITGISELVRDGRTGFLFYRGSIRSFIDKIERICGASTEFLEGIRDSAQQLISEQFDRETNLAAFADLLLEQTSAAIESAPNENLVLQQI